ncbi:MAG: helicase SNF2 [Acidobacteria bacterium]|nr:helicase SNF2 [Acidobacteriota bacterium]
MALAPLLAHFFTHRIRQRGLDYFRRGWVSILHGGHEEVEAVVTGNLDYTVLLRWGGQGLVYLSCDCPHYESGEHCKHLWATVLAADLEGHLRTAASSRRLSPIFEEPDGGFDEFAEVDDIDEEEVPRRSSTRPVSRPPAPKPPAWRQDLEQIAQEQRPAGGPGSEDWPADRRLLYVVEVDASLPAGAVVLVVLTLDRKKDGQWGKPKELRLTREGLKRLPEGQDRDLLALLAGAYPTYYGYAGWQGDQQLPARFQLPFPLCGMLMPRLAATGRCALRLAAGATDLFHLEWDEGGPWRFELELAPADGGSWTVLGALRRGEERMELHTPALLLAGGLVFTRERIAPLDDRGAFTWIRFLRHGGVIQAADAQKERLLAELLEHPVASPLVVPEALRYEEVCLAPRPCLKIRSPGPYDYNGDLLRAELEFAYEGRRVPQAVTSRGLYDPEGRRFTLRDQEAEAGAVARMRELGFQLAGQDCRGIRTGWQLPSKKLPQAVRALVEAGWEIQAEGKTFRRSGAFRLEVTSGVDWFELRGEVDYQGTAVELPQLLKALRRGENMVRLDDGSYGLLPEEWLGKIGLLLEMGAPVRQGVRYARHQAGLLDALLAAQPEARCDEAFARVREQLRTFAGVEAAEQPAGFNGCLRDYQREGLGWMYFLRRFGFGGCLADDMGVGKTAQVLALLEARRQSRDEAAGSGEEALAGPALVVAPKSLVFNWKQEAERFTPGLRVLDYTGLARRTADFRDYHLILTTYGTLRRDVVQLRDIEFEYVVLDEAQAIKNADTGTAKAVRLLRGRNRLALSGTPVENHLGELWSLFEFLNPGMLGASRVFKLVGGKVRNPDEETRRLLAHALRPFILRRTKQQVARELPPKTEQTIYCEMEPVQRRLYDELRQHYRETLLGRLKPQELGRSKIQVLEALLRLRQAACHPGLLDRQRLEEPSAKLEVLLDQLSEVVEEGHKALVFSQFTSLLAIVRRRLERAGLVYEYLDGATRDRQARIERFQSDAACPLFLLSLKAGGLGLNLTAAEYVFLLDPWWNPAVEAQAMDRAHRIGQTRHVFAYRLIARDTVEEKVLELQSTKRDLAEAIISADRSLIRDLKREDLELLLS